MTAIGSILKSYLNPRRFVFWLLVSWAVGMSLPVCLALLRTAAASHGRRFYLPSQANYILFPLFFLILSAGIAAAGLHLRQMLLEGEETDMIPAHKERQLAAAGMIVMTNLIVFPTLTIFCGWHPLPALAGFLCVTALTLWFGLFFLGGLVLFFVVSCAAVLSHYSMCRILLETYQTVWASVSAHESMCSGLLIALSLAGIFLFYVRYLSITCTAAGNHRFFIVWSGCTQYLPLEQRAQIANTTAQEKRDSRENRELNKAVSNIAAARRGQRLSFFQMARLIHFAMCRLQTYGNGWKRDYSKNSIRAIAVFLGVLAVFFGVLTHDVLMLVFSCGIMATTTANVFQCNKNHLPMLYLQTDLPSKTDFMKAAATGYLLWVVECFLIFTCAALITNAFFSVWTWPYMFQVVIILAAMILVHISVLLLTGNRRKTQPGQGWIIGVMLLYLPFVIISQIISKIRSAWIAAGVCLILSALFFYAARRRWEKSEMDCA